MTNNLMNLSLSALRRDPYCKAPRQYELKLNLADKAANEIAAVQYYNQFIS